MRCVSHVLAASSSVRYVATSLTFVYAWRNTVEILADDATCREVCLQVGRCVSTTTSRGEEHL